MFTADTRLHSHCVQLCPSEFPPLITHGAPRATRAAIATKLRSIRRPDGTRQVTYAGHPLYRALVDTGAGVTRAQGFVVFGGSWWVLAPSGRRITRTG
jgi:predicted lipoprotein with Yx(FWY)xxD motif